MNREPSNVRELAAGARRAFLQLLGRSGEDREQALRQAAAVLRERADSILEANRRDLEAADRLLQSGDLSPALRARLVFDQKKLSAALTAMEHVIRLPDPSGRTLWRIELDRGLVLERKSCPLGVVGVIFESRPEVVVQVSSLLLKAGNAGILKGGSEAKHTNTALMEAIRAGLERSGGVPVDSLQLVDTREEVRALLDEHDTVDLLIPRGSGELVRQIQTNTRIPVLGHAEGICHVYIHEKADRDTALRVAVDSKTDYPAVCNAAETILVDAAIAPALLADLVTELDKKSVEIRACERARELLPSLGAAPQPDWGAEYLDLVVNLKLVDDHQEAAAHINRYGSHHTDAIVTEDAEVADHFCRYVDSSSVMVNASTRFADGFRYGLGAEIGISTNKIHARGPVGLEGIVTYKYELRGNGQMVGEYSSGKRSFTHRPL
jgi:glutamate-5-semialdehyde dehydrogenase